MLVALHNVTPSTWTSEILWPIELECLATGDPRGVVACTSQMFAEATPELSFSFINVKKWASAGGYAIDNILGLTSEMVTDGKGRFRTSYHSDRTYIAAGVASKTSTHAGTRLLNGSAIR